MKHLKLLGLAFIAMLSLTGILAATTTAATLPSILPLAGPGEEHILIGFLSKVSTFNGGVEAIESKKDEGTLEGTSLKLGLIDLLFLETEATLLKAKCTGLSDTVSGSVLVLGTYHIRDYNAGPTLRVALIVLLLPVHFECSTLSAVVSGCVAGQLTPENTLTKTLTVTLKKKSEDNEIITVLNEENTGTELCQLKSQLNGAATKLSSEETTEETMSVTQNGAAIELLVMRL